MPSSSGFKYAKRSVADYVRLMVGYQVDEIETFRQHIENYRSVQEKRLGRLAAAARRDDDRFVDEFAELLRTHELASQFAVVALHRVVEHQQSWILQHGVPASKRVDLHRFDVATKYAARHFGLDLERIVRARDVDEIRWLNNAIKHNGVVTEDLAEFGGWSEGAELRDVSAAYERLKSAVLEYLVDLAERTVTRHPANPTSDANTPTDDRESLKSISSALASAGRTVQKAKGALWPQDAKKGDIHESNYALHVAHALRHRGAHAYFEVPIISGAGGRLDLLAVHETEAWALAIEFKCLVSQAKDELIGYDIEKLDGLRLRRSSGSVDVTRLRCFTALAASSWQRAHEAWWCAGAERPVAPARAKRPESWAAIGRFLTGAGADGVGAVDLTVNSKYPHRLLYAVRAESEAGAFWRE